MVRVAGGNVTDRLTGRGTVALLGARLLAKEVHADLAAGRPGAFRGMDARDARCRAVADGRAGPAPCGNVVAPRDRGHPAPARVESADTHDVGFVYEAAAYGYDLGCRKPHRAPFTARRCRALRRSARAAADRLALMIRANAPAKLLPTHLARCPDCPPGARETIVDSMMNVGLLVWAQRRAGRGGYARLAIDHARGSPAR